MMYVKALGALKRSGSFPNINEGHAAVLTCAVWPRVLGRADGDPRGHFPGLPVS